jgi:plasmid stabilization system protein ParE
MRDIYAHSLKQWGTKIADDYLADIYAVIKRIAEKPEMGQPRIHRSAPFLMVPVRQHFIVYDRLPKAIVILTLLHQRRSIETVLTNIQPALQAEIKALRKNFID